MKEIAKKLQSSTINRKKQPARELPFEDDSYPGSFFKVPGVPKPGKTGWGLS